MRRRTFLLSSLGLSVGFLAPLSACTDGDETPLPKGPDEEGVKFGALQKGPYLQFLSPTTARLRFETRIDEETPVVIRRARGEERPAVQREATTLDYWRPAMGRRHVGDDKGEHVLHELLLEDLEPGELVSYTIEQHAGPPIDGEFRTPVASGNDFRLGWISDTMFPNLEEPVARLTALEPDVVIHGGDLTYDANPFDSWNQFMAAFAPLFRQSAVQVVVGNHEFESQDEISQQFDRLFNGQGGVDGTQRYHAFTYGGVRFICIDSESGDIEDESSAQVQWLDAQLAQAQSDPTIREIVAAFHRPIYTLSKHGRTSSIGARDVLHPRFRDAGVRLVLCGHAHSYEHFHVEGVHYIIDGGGGALLYNPDEKLEEIDEIRPGESELRVFASQTYGVTTVDFKASGGFLIERHNAKDGQIEHTIEETSPAVFPT